MIFGDEDPFELLGGLLGYFPIVEMPREPNTELRAGPLLQLAEDFGFRDDFDPIRRLFDPSLGGGALLDVGVYLLWLTQAVTL